MADYTCVAKADEIPAGQGRTVEVEGKKIAVFNVDGHLYAIDDTCVHRGGPLGQGPLDGNVVSCPWHSWRFEVATGACLTNPRVQVECFPVKIEGDEIWVGC